MWPSDNNLVNVTGREYSYLLYYCLIFSVDLKLYLKNGEMKN